MATANAVTQDPHFIEIPASADLSTYQYRFMTNTSGQAALPSSGGAVIGVLDNKPNAADKPATIQYSGVALVKAAGSITAGGKVQSDASGLAVAQSGSGIPAGWAMKSVSADEYCPVLLASQAGIATVTTEETVTSGALSLNAKYSYLSVTSTQAYTLAAGTYVGQEKIIECTVAATTPLGTLTLADAYGSESLTHVFTAVGQKLKLEWRTTGWKVVEKVRVGDQILVVGTTLTAGMDLCARYNLSVTDTVASAVADGRGIPNGMITGEGIDVQVTTAGGTPSGSIEGVFATLDNGAATTIGAADGTTSRHVRFVWDGSKWQVISLTGLTVS